jgi:hypothetical protein
MDYSAQGETGKAQSSTSTTTQSLSDKQATYEESLQAYTSLSHLLYFNSDSSNALDISYVPILMIPDVNSLCHVVGNFIHFLTSSSQSNRAATFKLPVRSHELLSYCTTAGKLKDEDVVALTDAFVDLKDVIRNATAQDPTVENQNNGADRLEAAVGMETATTIREFFSEEWVID